MKFGRSFHRHQLPDWAFSYMNYNTCKRLFKTACISAHELKTDADFTELFAGLSRELYRVETFYIDKYATIHQKTSLLYTNYGTSPNFPDTVILGRVDQYEIEDLLGCSIELFEELEKLQLYGKVNRDGFKNLFCKLDKVRSSSNYYIHNEEAKFYDSQFANQTQCLEDLERINRFIAKLTRASVESRSSTTHVSLFLQNFCTRFYPSLISPNAVYLAIREDDVFALDNELRRQGLEYHGPSPSFRPFLLALLQCSVSRGSRKCIDKLLSRVGTLKDENFANSENCFHRLPVSLGWRQRLQDQRGQQSYPEESAKSLDGDVDNHPLLIYILDRLRPDQQGAFQERDLFGRLPLHYAAMYGLLGVIQGYLKHMQGQEQCSTSIAAHAIVLQDSEGYTPLHYGVIGGYPAVTRTLLEVYGEKDGTDEMAKRQNLQMILGPLLAIAMKLDSIEIVQTLITHHANVNYQGVCGETPLYIAAQLGREGYVKTILRSQFSHIIDLDLSETVHGWTPLFVACVEGQLSIVRFLLEAGANQALCDLSGWTVKEHAVFRGHLKIADLLATFKAKDSSSPSRSNKFLAGLVVPGMALTCAIEGKEQVASSLRSSGIHGRQYPTKEAKTRIFVTLGPMNTRKKVKAVDLSPCLSDHPYAAYPEIAYSIEIGAIGATGSTQVIQLPMLEDMTNEPWLFTAEDPSKVKLVFSIFRTTSYNGRDNEFIGSGIALLHSLREGLLSRHESLIRDYTIPILGKASLKLIGSVTFSFIIATPFPHPTVPPIATRGFWKTGGPTQVVGHRGSGANSVARSRLQIGENTVQSFLTATALGASCVEFDVQLTKEFVPVIFHDFLVMETGGDTRLHTLSLTQFMHLSKAQSSRGDLSTMAEIRYLQKINGQVGQRRRPRSHSLNAYDNYRSEDLLERMKYTEEGMHDAIKGNLRGHSIQEPSSTLEELLVNLPESVAFNVEMKYPMLWEAEDRNMDLYDIELNIFVDTILDKIYRLGARRSITFSSFSPEICILLSSKQQDYPILFINKAGSVPTGDVRAGSLQQAIQFAKSWNLAGIVMLSDPFVMCPRLVQYAKSLGLVCGSYGDLNDDPEYAMIQADAGLDAIMVNRVRLISETLNKATS